MSELQLGLLIIGAVIIVAVFAYNQWQDRKYRKLAEQRFSSAHPDALLDGGPAGHRAPAGRVDEVRDDHSAESAADRAAGMADDGADDIPDLPAPESGVSHGVSYASVAERIEPTLDGDHVAAVEPAAAPIQERRPAHDQPVHASAPAADHAGIDFVAQLSGEHLVDPRLLASGMAEVAGGFTKPVWIDGWTEAGWTELTPDLRSTVFRIGIQLADRSGVLSMEEMARFAAAASTLADQAGLQADMPDAGAVAKAARELDQFCSEVDIQVVLNLVSTGAPFPGTKIRALAESAGFALEEDGQYRQRDEEGVTLFALSAQGGERFEAARMRDVACHGLAFQYDLPRVPGGLRSFDHFCDIARNFANVLGGRLVDDNRAEIGQQALRAIRAQVQRVHAAMESRGIPAGSGAALRLFS